LKVKVIGLVDVYSEDVSTWRVNLNEQV